MAGEQWVVVPNWDKFQHYSDRDPTWIKVYSNINSSADFLQLSCAERGLLLTIWAEYARSSARVLRSHVQTLCGSSARAEHWKALNDAGFIEFSASKPLALTRSREKRREEKKEARASAPAKNSTGRFNMRPVNQEAHVRALIANHVITEPFELDSYDLDEDLRGELRTLL